MGRMGEFEQYERDCQRRRIENSSEYGYLEEQLKKSNEMIDELLEENKQLKEELQNKGIGR